MRKQNVLLLCLLVVIVGAVVFAVMTGDKEIQSDPETTPLNVPAKTTEMPQSVQAGQYVVYSESVVKETMGTKILFFHASWCPQCRALESDIQKQGVPEDTTIFKVDYDNAQELRKKYGVTLQTTVVKIGDNGELISKFTPYQKPTLANALDNL